MRLVFISILEESIKKIKFKRDAYLIIIKIIKKATHLKSFLSDLSSDKIIPLKAQESFLMSLFYHLGEKECVQVDVFPTYLILWL